MADFYKILGVTKKATQEEIKQAFRKLARKYHPDVAKTKKAEERFKQIAEAHEVLSDPDKRKRYDDHGTAAPIFIVTKNGKYQLSKLLCSGDLADIHLAEYNGEKFVLKVAKDPSNNDLIENEARVLNAIYPPKQVEEKRYRYLPRLRETLKIDTDGKHRQMNVIGWLENYYTLSEVRDAYSRHLAMEHGVWMFNRILEGLSFIHDTKKYVHGAVLPDHVMVYASGRDKDPFNHGARIIDWCYAVPLNGTVRAISPKFISYYPPELLNKKPVTPATDIYMAAKCIIHVLGGDVMVNSLPSHIPSYFSRFLKGCVLSNQAARPQDAWALHEELKDFMAKHYGPKKYVPFNMPA